MGFTQKLKEVFNRTKKEPEVATKLEGLGVTILKDKKLADKLELLQALFDDLEADIETTNPLTYLLKLEGKQKTLNRAVHSLAAPYYRSGTIANFRLMMEGWALLNALAEYWIHAVEDRIKTIYVIESKTDLEGQNEQELIDQKATETIRKTLASVTAIDVWTLVRRLHTVLLFHIFQDGMYVLAVSYLQQDVAPTTATVIKTLTQRGGYDFSELKPETVE